jgi:hypothetical protein
MEIIAVFELPRWGPAFDMICPREINDSQLRRPMFIHIFAFRWKPSVTESDKERVATAIRALQGQIPGLLETFVGRNVSPRGAGYDLGGVMKFDDQAALDAYGGHPVHQQLLTWLLPLIEPIEVDFPA